MRLLSLRRVADIREGVRFIGGTSDGYTELQFVVPGRREPCDQPLGLNLELAGARNASTGLSIRFVDAP